MKTDKRISMAMEELFQNQIKEEMLSSNIYLHMSNWCNMNGYLVAWEFFKKHAKEERKHAKGMVEYLLDRNCMPVTPALDTVSDNYSSLKDVLQNSYEHEKYITQKLNDIYALACTEKEYVSMTFIAVYVNEQREEESLFNDLLMRLELADNDMAAILRVEHEMK
jgi:ferritin